MGKYQPRRIIKYLTCSEWFDSPEERGDIKDRDLETEGIPFEMQQLRFFQKLPPLLPFIQNHLLWKQTNNAASYNFIFSPNKNSRPKWPDREYLNWKQSWLKQQSMYNIFHSLRNCKLACFCLAAGNRDETTDCVCMWTVKRNSCEECYFYCDKMLLLHDS